MIYLCLEGLEGFVVLDGELVAVVEGFADFVFLELLFVVGRGHCEADFGYAGGVRAGRGLSRTGRWS